jgi:GH43 family beta-xylosidase
MVGTPSRSSIRILRLLIVATTSLFAITLWADEDNMKLVTTTAPARVLAPVEVEGVATSFANPIYEGADPWVIRKDGRYYLCRSEGDQGISVWVSDRLTDPGVKRIVWEAPEHGWNSSQVWAPELHYLDGKWYIYYAASDGKNENHRAGVLEARTDDPQGEYIDRGMLYTGDHFADQAHNRWAIDATPLQLHGKLYLLWSGWEDDRDIQYLYIAPMSNPYTVAGNRVRLCDNCDYLWERVDERPTGRGLHEGPQVIHRHGKIFVVYSCSGSWQRSYKLGMIWMDEHANPLDPRSWKKHDRPVFQGNDRVLGVGHASFVRSPDDTEDWIVYHTKIARRDGWERVVHVQKFGWTEEGFPDFGTPSPTGMALQPPRGEPANQRGSAFADSFDDQNWDNWVYYGYNRYIWVQDSRLSLGGHPRWGLVNHFRSGEKALVRGLEWSNLVASVRLMVQQGHRGAGLMFRVRRPAVGYDAWQGYFAGVSPGTNRVILGKCDGTRFQELASVEHTITPDWWHTLRVEAIADRIRVYLNNEKQIEIQDDTYSRGMAGVRVVDTHALFDEFAIATP